MALLPVKMMWPFRLDPNTSQSFTVEDEITTVSTVFDPVLRFYNTSAGIIHLKIVHVLDLGFGDDPFYSGTWTFTVVDEDVPANTFRDYTPTPQIDNDTTVVTRQTATITNADLVAERVVRFILFGSAEVMTQVDASQAIIKSPVP